jgi:ABC-type multidrug transport system permease subunit
VACAWFAYSVDTRRADDDPQKRDFDPLAVVLAPITFPFLFVLAVFIFILRALLFGLILILFAMALIGAREPFIFKWLGRKMIAVGNRLLGINTFLIRLFWRPKAAQSRTANSPSPYNLDSLANRFV